MLRQAIPVMHVSDYQTSLEYYQRLGFVEQFCYRLGEQADPAYFGLKLDDTLIHLSSFSGDGCNPGVIYFIVEDVDQLHRRWQEAGIDVGLPPTDQTWNNREMYLEDPDGNSLRFVVETTSE